MLYNILRLFLPLRYRRSSLTAVALGLAFSWLRLSCSRDLVGVIISVYYTFTSLLHYIILLKHFYLFYMTYSSYHFFNSFTFFMILLFLSMLG